MKDLISHHHKTCGNGDLGDKRAICKGIAAHIHQALRKRNIFKTGARGKRLAINHNERIGQDDLGQRRASVKRTHADNRERLREKNVAKIAASLKRAITNIDNRIGNDDLFKSRATAKGIAANCEQGFGQGDRRDIGIAGERTVCNIGNVIAAEVWRNDNIGIDTVANADNGAGNAIEIYGIRKTQGANGRNDLLIQLCTAVMAELTHKTGLSCIGIGERGLLNNGLFFNDPFARKVLLHGNELDLPFTACTNARFLPHLGAGCLFGGVPLAKCVRVLCRGLHRSAGRCAFIRHGVLRRLLQIEIERTNDQNAKAGGKRAPFRPHNTATSFCPYARCGI